MRTTEEIYQKYFIDNNLERKDLFEALNAEYSIGNALYPGSFTHITASFYIPEVVYVDTDKQAKRFFKDCESVKVLIDLNKMYPQESIFNFIGENYSAPLYLKDESFDFLISQFSGIISRYCKNYLKIGGLLLANNSHADAGVAHLDEDYELVAVTNEVNGRTKITADDLKSYFVPKGTTKPTIESLMKSGKGIKYTKTADNYIFKRVN
jgi:hypothetical protein